MPAGRNQRERSQAAKPHLRRLDELITWYLLLATAVAVLVWGTIHLAEHAMIAGTLLILPFVRRITGHSIIETAGAAVARIVRARTGSGTQQPTGSIPVSPEEQRD